MLEGVTENGDRFRLSGRRAAVGKPLIAAGEMLNGRICAMDESAGLVIQRDSYAGRKINERMKG